MRVAEASVYRLHASFSAKFAPQRPSQRLSGLLKPHVAPCDSYSILRPSTQDPKEEEEEIAREIKAYRQEHAQRRR